MKKILLTVVAILFLAINVYIAVIYFDFLASLIKTNQADLVLDDLYTFINTVFIFIESIFVTIICIVWIVKFYKNTLRWSVKYTYEEYKEYRDNKKKLSKALKMQKLKQQIKELEKTE